MRKNVFKQFQKKISQMSAVRTGVRAYMDATPLLNEVCCLFRNTSYTKLPAYDNRNFNVICFSYKTNLNQI